MNRKPAQQHSTWFVVVVAVFITCLLIANIISVKLVTIFGLVAPAGVIIFPLSYICGDVLTEVYGYRRTRQVIWLGFGCNVLAVLAIAIVRPCRARLSGMRRQPMNGSWASRRACSWPRSAHTWWANSPTRSCWPG